MWLTRISIRHPVFAAMMVLALLVLGLFSWNRLGVEEFPDVHYPAIVISTDFPGAAPEAVESDVTRPIERAMSTLGGLQRIYSSSYEGLSVVGLEFDLASDVEAALAEVRAKLAVVRPLLRAEVKEPSVSRHSPDDVPVVSLALASDRHDLRELSDMAERHLLRRLQTVPGVGSAALVGAAPREIEIRLDPLKLQALNVAVDRIADVLRKENRHFPAGSLVGERSEASVQVQGRLAEAHRFADLIVARQGSSALRLGDVADVAIGQAERKSAALVDGRPALSIDVFKIHGANTVKVADALRLTAQALQAELPAGMRLSVIVDRSAGIRNSLAHIERSLMEGAVLTVAVVFVFLGSWRSTVITGLTLPASLLGAVFAVYALGFSLNAMTLMALSLCVGLLIDDAIVVRESIVRHLRRGKPPGQAALHGTREIALAVLATTLTLVAVFLPVGFMGGIIGRFFHQFGLTVSAAVLISMFVSFTLDPMLSARWHDPHLHAGRRPGRIGRGLDRFEHALERLSDAYGELITWSLRRRKTVLAIGFAALAASLGAAALVGSEFIPAADNSEITVRAKVPTGASLEYASAKARQVDAALREFPEVASTYATVNPGGTRGKSQIVVAASLKPRRERTLGLAQLVPRLRARLEQIAGIEVKGVAGADSVTGGAKPIFLSVQGPDLATLRRLALQLVDGMRRVPGVVDIETSLEAPQPTLAVEVNRAVADDLGLGVARIGETLRSLVEGETVTIWQAPDGENYDVRLRLPDALRRPEAGLGNLRVATTRTDPATGAPLSIPLHQVATIQEIGGATRIDRRNQLREVRISADVSNRPAGDVGRELKAVMAQIALPPGYRFATEGANRSMEESFGHAVSALALAVIFIYMILASQFGSLLHPLAIMSSLPLSLVGVFLGLLAGGSTLNVFSAIGIIMLMGLVTKNAILLVDFVTQAVRSGTGRTQAIVDAGRTRLRPILMTTCAMVFGMLPLALGLGEGAKQRAPMAHAVIGGVITSTLLTLVVVPVAYVYLDDLGIRLRRLLSPEGRGVSDPDLP